MLRELGDRNIYEFTLAKKAGQQKVGEGAIHRNACVVRAPGRQGAPVVAVGPVARAGGGFPVVVAGGGGEGGTGRDEGGGQGATGPAGVKHERFPHKKN